MRQNSGLQHFILYLVITKCILTSIFVSESNAEFHFGGYYKSYSTVFDSKITEEPLRGLVANRLRLNITYSPIDKLSFACSYDFSPRVQDPLLYDRTLFVVDSTSSNYRAIDLDSLIYPDQNELIESVGIYHNLDRLYLQYSTDFADIIIGRDAIAWGNARIINPTDVVAPFTYNQLDTEDRIGIDTVRVRIPVGVLGEVDTGYIFGDNFNFDKSAFYLRTQLNAVETDFSVLLLQFQKEQLIGLDIARGIGGAGFWMETAYVFHRTIVGEQNGKKNYLRSSVGVDYSFGGETYSFIEYHYNGIGVKTPENYLNNLTHPAYIHGGVFLLGKHYLTQGITHQFTPILSFGGQVLLNLSDISAWIAPVIEYNIAEDIHLSIGSFFSFGESPKDEDISNIQSEFGIYPNFFFTSFRVYF